MSEEDRLNEEIAKLEDRYHIANENGLFLEQSRKQLWQDGLKLIQETRVLLSQNNLIEARQKLHESGGKFNEAVEKASTWWRVNYAYGIPLFSYLTIVLGLLLLLGYLDLRGSDEPHTLVYVPAWSFLLGG